MLALAQALLLPDLLTSDALNAPRSYIVCLGLLLPDPLTSNALNAPHSYIIRLGLLLPDPLTSNALYAPRSYIICLGLLLPAYSYTGIDGPAHMSEETRGAGVAPSKVWRG